MNPILLQKQLRDNAADLQGFCKDLKQWGEEMKRKEESLSGNPKKSKVADQKAVKKPDREKKVKKVRINEEKGSVNKKRIGTDYSAWEKFDADAECGKIDDQEYEDSDLTDECDELKRDEAMLQKEKGNKLVKQQKWDEAIVSYTKAIDFYRYDPIFYANRALCHLKMKRMNKAEEDCTLSLKLDPTYVKAYQRRAAAREALNELEGAKYDLEQVLEYEPNNKESKAVLANLEKKIQVAEKSKEPQRPVSKFTASRGNKKIPATTVSSTQLNTSKIATLSPNVTSLSNQVEKLSKTVDDATNISNWPSGDDIVPVKAIKKPPHLQSKKPLKRIEIIDVDPLEKSHESGKTSKKQKSVAFSEEVIERLIDDEVRTLQTDDLIVIERQPELVNSSHLIDNKSDHQNSFKVIEKKPEDVIVVTSRFVQEKSDKINSPTADKNTKNTDNGLKKLNSLPPSSKETITMTVPKTSVQFYSCWRYLKSRNVKYEYLSKYIKPDLLSDIFKESLDTDVFSEFVSIMAEYFIPNKDPVYEFLLHLTSVRRFSTLAMFMTSSDKSCLWKLIDYIKENENAKKEDVDELIKKYEL